MRVLAITTMRNEAPFILEWIAYHQHIGVTDFLIFSNDCEDGTDLLLDRLDAMGVIKHLRNHAKGKKTVQWRALAKAQRQDVLQAADWVYVTDVDEFLCIHCGDGKIADLQAACPDAAGFAIPWRMFGNAGRAVFEDQPVTAQFTQAAPEALLWPWRAVQFKSLYRNDDTIAELGIHAPKLKPGHSRAAWVDGNGDHLTTALGTVVPSEEPRYGLAQINHYALGSIEGFLVKVARGRPNHTSEPIDLAYWSDRNFNSVQDDRITRHLPAVQDRMAAFQSDQTLKALHDAGVVWRNEKISRLLRISDPFYMATRIRQMGTTEVLPMSIQRQLFNRLMTIRRATAMRKTLDKNR